MNVVEEIVDIRERLARMEGNIEHLVESVDQTKKEIKQVPATAGGIVIPLAAVTILVNAFIAVLPKILQHL